MPGAGGEEGRRGGRGVAREGALQGERLGADAGQDAGATMCERWRLLRIQRRTAPRCDTVRPRCDTSGPRCDTVRALAVPTGSGSPRRAAGPSAACRRCPRRLRSLQRRRRTWLAGVCDGAPCSFAGRQRNSSSDPEVYIYARHEVPPAQAERHAGIDGRAIHAGRPAGRPRGRLASAQHLDRAPPHWQPAHGAWRRRRRRCATPWCPA